MGPDWETLCAATKESTRNRIRALLEAEQLRKSRVKNASHREKTSNPGTHSDVPPIEFFASQNWGQDTHLQSKHPTSQHLCFHHISHTPIQCTGQCSCLVVDKSKSDFWSNPGFKHDNAERTQDIMDFDLDSASECYPTRTFLSLNEEDQNWEVDPLSKVNPETNNTSSQLRHETNRSVCTTADVESEADKYSVVSASTRFSKISDTLKGLGRTPSERSLIKRTLRLRFSMSSLDILSDKSISKSALRFGNNEKTSIHVAKEFGTFSSKYSPDEESEIKDWLNGWNLLSAKVSATPIMEVQQDERIILDNHSLLQQCCAWNTYCAHRRILLCMRDPRATFEPSGPFEISKENLVGRSILFFAARIAAPLRVLLALIDYLSNHLTNILDENGRTFMFHLDPSGLLADSCQCTKLHASSFECLMEKLRSVDFSFVCFDNEGKNFLDMLCLSKDFKIDWLISVMMKNDSLRDTFKSLAHCHDSSGLSFVDRLDSDDFDKFASFWSPCATLATFSLSSEGLTQVQRILSETREKSSWETQDDDLLRKIKLLHDQGANLHTRSGDGTTPLIFAARCVCPKTVEYLLSIGVSFLEPDESGWTAKQYIMANFNATRKSSVATDRLANALKMMIQVT